MNDLGQQGKNLLFVGDGGKTESLDRALRDAGFTVHYEVERASLRGSPLFRHWTYVKLALRALRLAKHHDSIFVWQQFVGIYLSFISRLPIYSKKPTYLYYIIYKPSGNKLINALKFKTFHFATSASIFRKIFFISRYDRVYEHVESSRRAVINNVYKNSALIEAHASSSMTVGAYVASGGTSNRRYSDISVLAEARPDLQFRIACRPDDVSEKLPINLSVAFDLYDESFDELIASSKAVVLPLDTPNVASGQLVLLKALQAGKVTFMTDNSFIHEWLNDTDFQDFLILYRGESDLVAQFNAMNDAELQARGAKARAFFVSQLSEDAFSKELVRHLV